MSAVAPYELARLWAEEQLPTERAIGQLLQHVVTMQATLERQSRVIAELRSQLTELSTCDTITSSKAQRKQKR